MRSPLTDLHNALYTAMTDNISSATTYSFVPQAATYPYIYIERKQSRRSIVTTSSVEHTVRVKLIVATNDKDISVVEGIIGDIEAQLDTVLTLSNNWTVVDQDDAPDVDVFPGQNFDGSQGHAADIFYNFTILDVS